jgi:hypothetical protein
VEAKAQQIEEAKAQQIEESKAGTAQLQQVMEQLQREVGYLLSQIGK